MLIYVNQFKAIGVNSFSATLRSISGWLKVVTNHHFTNDMLLSGDEFKTDKAIVRTFAATEIEPAVYSILLSHPDRSVKGRQWVTEIGIRFDGDSTLFSILLQTSDVSTLVREIPKTTRPKLIDFLAKNADLDPNTVGLKVQKVSNNDDFRALSFDIDRTGRDYPLVLISSCKENGKPLVDPELLQSYLIGLAQVVWSDSNVDTWELESVLTRRYSAWDGAINIIFPSFGRDLCSRRLLLKDYLLDVDDNLAHLVLSYVTHTTNGFNKKKHFSPTDVRAKRQRDSRIKLKRRFAELNNDSEYQELAEQAFEQLEEQENVVSLLKEKHELELMELIQANFDLQEELDKSQNDVIGLKYRLDGYMGNNCLTGRPIVVFGEESEKYDGEISDLVIEAVESYSINLKPNTRKSSIAIDVLNGNVKAGRKEELVDELKSIFSNYSGMTSSMHSALKRIGFEVVDDGNHNHLLFESDQRYKVAFAKTPSDTRVGKNIIRDIKSALL